MKIVLLFFASFLFIACNGLKSIKSALTGVSPYEHYVESLEKAELLNAPMARDWLLAGKKVFKDSVMVALPFAESGFFQASNPEARRHSYYFAHLDSQMVTPGMHVRQGHVLGLVGNTGNARRTAPHLHFGIYQSGSKDPLYYIRTAEAAMESLPVDTGFHQQAYKVRLSKIKLMAGPSKKNTVKALLEKETYCTVIGQSHKWFRVSLPDNTEGFVLKNQLSPLSKGTLTILDTANVLLSENRAAAIPVALLDEDTAVEVLARFQNYDFVRTENGNVGWLSN